MPELGLSEDVFSDQPQDVEDDVTDVEAQAPDAAAEIPEQPGGEDTEQE
jgi:hypothetical protein